MSEKLYAPIHPGEVLMEDFIQGKVFAITQNKLAVSIGVPPRRINEIVHGKPGHHRRHGVAAESLLWNVPPVLAQFADAV